MENTQEGYRLSFEDKAFFDEFYQSNCRLIAHFAGRYTESQGNREDLMQDVLLRLMKHIPSLKAIADNRGQTAYYICAVTQSVFVDRLRQEEKSKQLSCSDEVLESLIEERLSSQRVPVDNAYWDVELLKHSLPKRDWMLLEGKYIIGYTDEELGLMLGCAKDSVRMLVSRAKKKARKLLFEEDRGGVQDE